MFKLFVIYPFITMVCIWLASDVELKTSIRELNKSSLSLQFPKATLRADNSEPWLQFHLKGPDYEIPNQYKMRVQ